MSVKLATGGDIKEGLLKMMLYTNLENVSIDENPLSRCRFAPYFRESLRRNLFKAGWSLTYGMRNVTADSEQKANELFISNFAPDVFGHEQNAFAFSK